MTLLLSILHTLVFEIIYPVTNILSRLDKIKCEYNNGLALRQLNNLQLHVLAHNYL